MVVGESWHAPFGLKCVLAHLKTRAEFDAVFAGAVVAKSTHFILHFVPQIAPKPYRKDMSPQGLDAASLDRKPASNNSPLVVGAVLPKRWAKRAVTRNALKRQIYAVSESLATRLMPGCYIVRLRAGFSRTEFVSASSDGLKRAVRAELLSLWGGRLV